MKSTSTIYGPVDSWRVGRSLGVDLLYVDSVCSFRCVYCQLGRIDMHTSERRIFVPTEKVLEDLRASAWREADVITFSGSGEPTLASNLGEAIRAVKELTGKSTLVLTNSALLYDPQVRRELCEAESVFCKLDAADEATFQKINRPVAGATLRRIVEGLTRFRAEYKGRLGVQTMFMPLNVQQALDLAQLIRTIRPDEVQLNAPTRPVPHEWVIDARGNLRTGDVQGSRLTQITATEAAHVVRTMTRLTGTKIVSSYHQTHAN